MVNGPSTTTTTSSDVFHTSGAMATWGLLWKFRFLSFHGQINPSANEFTIHGLWPEPKGAESTEIFDANKLATLATELCKYWPNLKSTQQSIMREYFEKSLELHKHAGQGLRTKLAAEKIIPTIYNTYKLVDIQAAVNKITDGFSGTIICVQRQGSGNKQQIQEIRFSYNNNFQKQNNLSPSTRVPDILFPAPGFG
ncbi:ribonuclease 2-like protein [Tanacetum coccineum]